MTNVVTGSMFVVSATKKPLHIPTSSVFFTKEWSPDDDMDEATKAVYFALCFQLGIVPVVHVHDDVNRLMKGIDAVVVRKMKRKFRKLWRRLERYEEGRNGGARFNNKVRPGASAGNRKTAVKEHILRSAKAIVEARKKQV